MNLSTKKIWSRAINRLYTIFSTKIREKTFSSGENRVKYMFFQKNKKKEGQDALAVCFPAFAGKGAKYNYVRTLKKININKLFLLDDIGGYDKGNYLIKPRVEENVRHLIQEKIDIFKPKTLIFFGSSKGGYTALNFSLMFPNVNVCIAAPQYFLSDYLTQEKKYDNLQVILCGNDTEEAKIKLNNRLREKINHALWLPKKVYIHYSTEEHTYKEHIKEMLADLKAKNIKTVEDISNYTNHTDLVYFFPDFLKKSVKDILNNK